MPPATYRPDAALAQHLLALGFTDTTGSAYCSARGWLSFYHQQRGLSVWLQPNKITLTAGASWRFEAHGQVLAETLDFLLTAHVGPTPEPLAASPTPRLPLLGYRHQSPTPTLPTSAPAAKLPSLG